ncbi:MAG: hypothetical protein KJ718_02400 [Nanoarchaeota archaeon]|nr:hypothetical protein [Nanoarchaeota archaeon]MBU1051382.1 hypothetical protein [Nanoarchaeota archaeon]MBU1987870.1 hypothetical protein [Nanoarchaeota archaeon]
MPKKSVKKTSSKKSESKTFAWLATFLTIIGFIIALIVKRDDEYVMYYAKQGLVLFIGQIIIAFVSSTPLFGNIIEPLLWVFWFVLWLIAWINALSGEKKETWLVQDIAKKIKL